MKKGDAGNLGSFWSLSTPSSSIKPCPTLFFLILVFWSTFITRFGENRTGLISELGVMYFVKGLLFQEAIEVYRQGPSIYFSKWWNVVDASIVLTLLLAYIISFGAWEFYGEWKPREAAFIVADSIYATAAILAYFHLAHINPTSQFSVGSFAAVSL